MAILKMTLERFERPEGRVRAEGAAPFNAVDLEFMTEPGVTICKHFQVTFFECADVWFEVLKYMFPAELHETRRQCLVDIGFDLLPCSPGLDELRCPTVRTFERKPTNGFIWKWRYLKPITASVLVNGCCVRSL